MNPICWCGKIDLTIFSDDYVHCSRCDTLIAKDFPQKEISRVSKDEEDFSGNEDRWSHQTGGLGLLSIENRSRTKLLDRCGHWLKTLLKFRLAPCRLLDIGYSQGAFVALTELAGHTSTGLELSPWVIEDAGKAFGSLADQNFAGSSFDVVTLFDVVEHLQDPRKTVKECARILSPDGILIIKTPSLPTDATLEILRGSQHPFLKMLLPEEHLFLFSRRAIVRLLEEAGLKFVRFEKAPFGNYDMLLAASRSELKTYEDSERRETLQGLATGHGSPATRAARNATSAKDTIRIGVDLIPMLPGYANGGAKSAALEFIKTLLRDFADQFHLTLFVPEVAQGELHAYFSGQADLNCTYFGPRSTNSLDAAMEELKSQTRIRRICREKSIEVFYSPFGRFLSLPLAMPFIAQVHDLIHLDYPQTLCRKDRLWRHFNMLKLSLREAIFQVSSEFTRRRLHAAYSIPLDRIERTYLPIHGRFTKEAGPRDGAYFLYPARPWPHKNHEKLLHAHSIYGQKLGDRAWNLVLTAEQDRATNRLPSLASNLNLGSNVRFMGEVEEEELSRVYQSASALIFPSRYEGFGIPLVEAMHFGLPIICGRAGSQREVAGDAALYVDVEDPQDIAGAMARLTEDKVLRDQLTANGRLQLQRFILETEMEKLTSLFSESGDARWSSPHLRPFQTRLAILSLEFFYAASSLCLSFPIGSCRK
jgi:glycosyltransferase involved in cell wall biosynthesis